MSINDPQAATPMNASDPNNSPGKRAGPPASPTAARSSSEREALLGDYVPPSPRQALRRRAVILGVTGFACAAMLLVVVLNIDRPQPAQPEPSPEAREVIAPEALSIDEQSRAATDLRREIEIVAPQGGWIQLMKDGRLAQQYRCDRLDPNPPGKPAGWLNMHNPKVELYLNDGRAISLRGRSALLHAPKRELESGTISGDVLIQMYELGEARTIDEARDVPALIAATSHAAYDNFQGEIRCEGAIEIESATVHLPGDGLRVLLNEVEGRLEWLEIARAGEIRLAMESAPSPAAEAREAPRAPATAPSSSAGPRPRATPQQAAAKAPRFYRLNLTRNVRVRQHDWMMTGEDLNAVFSLESRGLDDVLAEAPLGQGTAMPGRSTQELLIALAFAVQPSATAPGRLALYRSTPDEIVIQCDGPLTMSPLGSGDEQPSGPDDAWFELVGAPVRIVNEAERASAACASLVYRTADQKLELLASSEHPLEISAPELRVAEARRLWIDRVKLDGGLDGPVRMFVGDRRTAGAGAAAVVPGAAAADQPVEITCAERVDLAFAPAADSSGEALSFGKLEGAAFHRDVNVVSGDFKLNSSEFEVALSDVPAAEGKTRRVLRNAVARRNVHALSVADQGELACDELAIDFAQDAFARTVPQRMTAQGNVAANDPATQIVWSDHLVVDFVALPPLAAGSDAPQRSRVEPSILNATGDVQVLTNDGARVFARALNADLTQEIAVFNEDVMLISDRGVLHGGTQLELRKRDSTATWPGAGEFISLASPLDVSAAQRMARPALDDPARNVEMRAAWQESMSYVAAANETDVDLLTMTGGVKAVSTPTALESDSLDAQVLALEFVRAQGEASASAETGESPLPGLGGGGRELKRMIARGDARLESRVWTAADRTDVPRVYYIAGQHVTYDAITLEALVEGAGQLLVRDVTPPPQGPQTQPGPRASVPFSAKGTTDFTWGEELRMTRREDGLFDLAMIGSIEVRHMALDESISTMVARRLDAVVARAQPATGPAQPNDRSSAATINLGGSMDLKRIRGAGAVYINTPDRDIDCETLDYDYARGIAVLDALPGRMVTVTTRGNPNPLTAERVEWNMNENTFTAVRPSGARPR